MVKSGKRPGPVQKDYHWIKRKATKFHKSSITYWAKTALQPKAGKFCCCHTVGGHNWSRYYFSITLNCFYYQENFKLINSLKFASYWKQYCRWFKPNLFFSNVVGNKKELGCLNLKYDLFNRNLNSYVSIVTICIWGNMGGLQIRRTFFLAFISAVSNQWLWN